MARVVAVGPLRLWSEHGSGGDVLICETAGKRVRHPRSDRSGRSALAWEVYRSRDPGQACVYGTLPLG